MSETWVIDESSYRIDKTAFADKQEAIQKASEAARILGRPISIYNLVEQDFSATNTHPSYDNRLQHAGRVHPDGSWEAGENPLENGEAVQPTGTVLGEVIAALDEIAVELDDLGEDELASDLDELVEDLSEEPNEE